MRNNRLSPLTVIALLILLAACSRGTVIKKSIKYEKDLMIVELYEKIDGKLLKDLRKEVDVAGMNKEDRDALGKKIFDSLAALPNNGR